MLTIKTVKPRAGHELGLHFPIPASSPKATTQFYANFINGGQSLFSPINGTSGVTVVRPHAHSFCDQITDFIAIGSSWIIWNHLHRRN